MEKVISYLVSSDLSDHHPVIYELEVEMSTCFVTILQNHSYRIRKPVLTGVMERVNNRAYVFSTRYFGVSRIEVALSRSAFTEISEQEFRQNYALTTDQIIPKHLIK